MRRIISLEDNVQMIYEEATKRILLHTPLLFIQSDSRNGSVEFLGSGVLYRKANRYYLLTAGHCLQQDGQLIPIGILDQSGLFRLLTGTAAVEFGNDDKIDMAVVCLTDECVKWCLQSYRFLDEHQVLSAEVELVSDYLIVGHPITKTSIDHAKQNISREPFVFISKSKELKWYDKLGYDEKISILLSYNRRHNQYFDEDEMNIGPHPKGISGCGLWYITSYFTEDITKVDYRLAGTMNQYWQQHNIMAGTKFQSVVDILKRL